MKQRLSQISTAFLIALVVIGAEVCIFNKPLLAQISLGLDDPDFVPSTTTEDLEKERVEKEALNVQASSEASDDTLNNDQTFRTHLAQEEANDEEVGYVEEEINENPNPPLAPEFLIKTKEDYLQHRRDLHEGWFEAEGYLSAKYFSRRVKVPVSEWNEKEYFETASDTYYRIGLDLTTPGAKRYEFHLFATARQRKDDGNNIGFDPFENIGYTRESKWMANIYEAHLAVNDVFPYMKQLRIGRMGGPRGPDELFYFDGLAAEFSFFTKMQLFVYGGSTVHLYEYYEKQDLIAGFGIDLEFAEESIFNFDYLYANDKRKVLTDYKGVYNDRKDEQISLEVWHRLSNDSKVMLKYRNLNRQSRDVKLRTIVEFPSTSTEISLKYFRQFETTDELSNTFAVFWVILREFLPWHAIDAKIRQRLGWHFLLDLGWYQSELLEEIPEEAYEFRGALNRDYTRNYVVLAVEDLLLDGLSMSLTAEHWNHSSKQFKDLQKSTDTTGWEVSYRFKRSGNRWKKGPKSSEISTGSYFMVHKYDYYDLDPRVAEVRYAEYFGRQERTEVQTYFAKFKTPIWFFTLTGGYEFEDGLEEYESYFAGLSLNF